MKSVQKPEFDWTGMVLLLNAALHLGMEIPSVGMHNIFIPHYKALHKHTSR
jgi:hypothetical protein